MFIKDSMRRYNQHHKTICLQAKFDTPELREFCENVATHWKKARNFIKNDKASAVWVTELQSRTILVKRIHVRSVWHEIKRKLGKNRLYRNWDNAGRLRRENFSTFEVIATVEHKQVWRSGPAYIILTFIDGICALDLLANGAEPTGQWPYYIDKLVALVCDLHNNHLQHRDLNPSNLIWSEDEWHLVDLDSMRPYSIPFFSKVYFKKECDRFLKNWKEAPGQHPSLYPLIVQSLKKAVYTNPKLFEYCRDVFNEVA